jgi:hypothetical protein
MKTLPTPDPTRLPRETTTLRKMKKPHGTPPLKPLYRLTMIPKTTSAIGRQTSSIDELFPIPSLCFHDHFHDRFVLSSRLVVRFLTHATTTADMSLHDIHAR